MCILFWKIFFKKLKFNKSKFNKSKLNFSGVVKKIIFIYSKVLLVGKFWIVENRIIENVD